MSSSLVVCAVHILLINFEAFARQSILKSLLNFSIDVQPCKVNWSTSLRLSEKWEFSPVVDLRVERNTQGKNRFIVQKAFDLGSGFGALLIWTSTARLSVIVKHFYDRSRIGTPAVVNQIFLWTITSPLCFILG